MPELPEVETVVRALRPDLVGRIIQSVWLDWPPGLVTPDSVQFGDRIRGQKITEISRRAKYIIIALEADWLVIHLKMTGRLYVVPDEAQNTADKWVHFKFQLDNAHQLRFSDARKFGKVYLTADLGTITDKLGPEPLDDAFTLDVFRERIAGRKGVIKPLLLNQAFVAGIGNIYADEALHKAHIAPTRKSDTLTDDEVAALHGAIRWALARGIERQGASISWYRRPDGTAGSMQDDFYAYGRADEPCRTCGQATIKKIVLGQRGTHFCPNCQQ